VWYQRKGSKYKNIKSEYKGIQYHSKKEAGYAAELEIRRLAGDIKDWERQFQISLDVNGYHICNYYIDFVITHNDGTYEYVEIKGFQTEVWRLKWKLAEAILSDQIKKGEVKLTLIT
jgi:hypothetical protein